MRVRIVVADQGQALFYDAVHADAHPELVGRIGDPSAHMHDRDFKSDRPGRVFDRAADAGRRGSVAHHATGGERTPRRHEAEMFARRITAELEAARHRGEFERLVLIAAPAFLGLLRAALGDSLQSIVVYELDKDLVHADDGAVTAHLPRTVFVQGITQ